jgi:glycosyltransferase involved in cell wall biosynthesis
LRILVVTEHFWPEAFRINDLAEGLTGRGHKVEVVTGLPNYPEGRFFGGYGFRGPYREDHAGVEVHRVPILPRWKGRSWQLALNYLSFVMTATLRLLFSRSRWDAVLVFQPTPVTTILPALVLRARGVRVCCWIQDLWPDTLVATGLVRSPRLIAWITSLSRYLYRRCHRILIQSEAYRAQLLEMGLPDDRIEHLPNWAEDVFTRVGRVGAGEPDSRPFSVVFAGNLGRVQALKTVLDAATIAEHRSPGRCRWLFAGDGVLREWLAGEIRARTLEEAVSLLGRRPLGEMPELFGRADALLVSLRADPVLAMTVPSKVQSYLAAGRPILGSLDGEGARILREAGAGFVSPAEDAMALAENVVRMMSLGPEDREALGRSGRVYYSRHFDRNLCLEKLERALEGPAA